MSFTEIPETTIFNMTVETKMVHVDSAFSWIRTDGLPLCLAINSQWGSVNRWSAANTISHG